MSDCLVMRSGRLYGLKGESLSCHQLERKELRNKGGEILFMLLKPSSVTIDILHLLFYIAAHNYT